MQPLTYLRPFDLMACWQTWNEARKTLQDPNLSKSQVEELIGPEKMADLRGEGLRIAKVIAARKFARKPKSPAWTSQMSKSQRDYSGETFKPIATAENFEREIRGRMGGDFFDGDFDQRVFTLAYKLGMNYNECKIIMGADYLACGFKLYKSWPKFLGRTT